MSVSPADAVRHLRERLQHRPESDLVAEASARALLPSLVQRLRQEGAQRVVLFGSLVDGLFREGSDIDLAVSGLSESVLARLEHEFTVTTKRAVELANLETVSRHLRERIEHSGQDLA